MILDAGRAFGRIEDCIGLAGRRAGGRAADHPLRAEEVVRRDRAHAERLDLLDGARSKGAIGKAAVRLDNLKALLAIQPMKAKPAAGATPTAARRWPRR